MSMSKTKDVLNYVLTVDNTVISPSDYDESNSFVFYEISVDFEKSTNIQNVVLLVKVDSSDV